MAYCIVSAISDAVVVNIFLSNGGSVEALFLHYYYLFSRCLAVFEVLNDVVDVGSLEGVALTIVVPVACEELFKCPLVAVKAHYDNVLSSIGDATAVVCYNDEIAYMLIKFLTAHGKRVPEDIAVVSFDNSNLSEMSAIKITSLSYGDMNIGTIAAKKLVDILKGQKVSSERIPWTLEEKESS